MIFFRNRIPCLPAFLLPLTLIFSFDLALGEEQETYRSFADYPGFTEVYGDRCGSSSPAKIPTALDQRLLTRFRPHFIVPPAGRFPISFYGDYLPYAVLRAYPDEKILSPSVTRETLISHWEDLTVYLDFDFKKYRAEGKDRKFKSKKNSGLADGWRPTIYGRAYYERVVFPGDSGGQVEIKLVFLKYNLVFPVSGLPKCLPFFYEGTLRLAGMSAEDWHQLDNFVAVYIVLTEGHEPIAAILAQHNHHQSYLIGKHLPLPHDDRLIFDIALRSNEIYPSLKGEKPVRHRVIRWSLYKKYLLTGEDPPFFRGDDLTYGMEAGGTNFDYDLVFLSSCDPFYTAKIHLGEPRPFFSKYIGRDGPPGADYYAMPALIAPGNLLKSSYLHNDRPEDILFIEKNFNLKEKSINHESLLEYGGRKFLGDLREIQ